MEKIIIKSSIHPSELNKPGIEAWQQAHQLVEDKMKRVYEMLADTSKSVDVIKYDF